MEGRKKKSILIVDDDKAILRVFTRILQREGYNTESSENGSQATDKIASQFYDLILIDVKLPDMDGTELLKKIHGDTPNTVKIMITGYPMIEDGIKALKWGAVSYVVKPVKPEQLINLIAEKLEQQEGSSNKI
jgi:DNA-binding NtrC family response regulator